MVVHSVVPDALAAAVDDELRPAGVRHIAHGGGASMRGAEAAAGDTGALALVGPYRSAEVAEAVEATAPVGLPLLAPVATWAGVTRDDEPGCEDAARHRGTVLRLVARDTEVAMRIAADLRASGQRAIVLAGNHLYGQQLEAQLRCARVPRADDPADADVVIVCGLVGDGAVDRAAALAPLPIVAFDGVQGTDLQRAGEVRLALPMAPAADLPTADLMAGVGQARRAAQLIAASVRGGARDRASLLAALRELGPFDEHGDPIDPPVWLWRARADWALTPDRPLARPS